jgi:hypothetical protein
VSARFGRNQRRRLRADIAALDREVTRVGEVAKEAIARAEDRAGKAERAFTRLQADMTEWAERIVAVLGEKSAFARDVAVVGVDQAMWNAVSDGRPYRVAPIPVPTLRDFDKPVSPMTAYRTIDAFAVAVEHARDELHYRTRFLIRWNGSDDDAQALMMDERTLYEMRRTQNEELAHYLLKRLVEPWMATGKRKAA